MENEERSLLLELIGELKKANEIAQIRAQIELEAYFNNSGVSVKEHDPFYLNTRNNINLI